MAPDKAQRETRQESRCRLGHGVPVQRDCLRSSGNGSLDAGEHISEKVGSKTRGEPLGGKSLFCLFCQEQELPVAKSPMQLAKSADTVRLATVDETYLAIEFQERGAGSQFSIPGVNRSLVGKRSVRECSHGFPPRGHRRAGGIHLQVGSIFGRQRNWLWLRPARTGERHRFARSGRRGDEQTSERESVSHEESPQLPSVDHTAGIQGRKPLAL
jgi:hypothetical protein